jgi:transposase
MGQPRSGRPHKVTELDRILQNAEAVSGKNCLSSVATLTTEFQTASGSNVSTRTVHRELHEMGFREITMCNAKC